MRKTWIIACAAAAAVFAGCNREFDAPVPGDGFLRATIETPSRVSFTDEGVFSWQAGDAIAVSTNAGFKTFTLQSGEGAASGVFDGDLGGVTSATVAVYPAAVAKDDATVTLPAEYAWAEGQSNAVMFCDKVSLTEVNSFKHLGGILKIAYAGIPADADALVLKAEAKITGDFTIADGVIAAGAGTDEVKVTFAAGSNPAAFYIPVPTGEYKFSVELQKAGAAIEGTQKATANAVKIARKSLILMDPIAGPDTPELKTEIATAEDFLSFVENAKLYAATDEVKLTGDIELPASYAPDSLYCSVDGQGHKVTYALDFPEEFTRSVGLFSYVNENLTVKNLQVAGTIQTEKVNVGGVAGKAAENVTFENCSSTVSITANADATFHLGGICGDAGKDAVFRNCRNDGALVMVVPTGGNTNQAGGIVGHIEVSGLMEDCVNNGAMEFTGKGTPRMAGMVGYVQKVTSMTFRNCVNNADLTSRGVNESGYSYLGGISGYFGTAQAGSEVLYERCTNNGKLEAEEGALQTRMGGIVSHGGLSKGTANSMTWTVKDCVNNGDVISAGTVAKNHLGGIVSMVETSAILVVVNCTNNAKVSVAGLGAAGGILGNTAGSKSSFTDVFVTAASVIEAKGAGNAGLIAGIPGSVAGAFTGKVGAAKHILNGTETVATAENYQSLLMGKAMAAGATTDGVVFDGTPMVFSGGSGTEADPYILKTADDLIAFSANVNGEATSAEFAGKCYRQLADIDMAGKAYAPAGKYSDFPFTGQYDGGGKQILNLATDGESSANPVSGLFGYALGAKLSNIVLKDRTNTGSFGYVAGLVGRADNCQVSGCTVIGGVLKTGGSYAGGISAYMNGGTLTSCTVSGLKIESGNSAIGGFVGEFGEKGALDMADCVLTGAVITGKQNIGGLIGWYDAGTVKNCTVTGNSQISASADGVGGLVGRGIAKSGATCLIDGCLVENSTVKGSYSVGGLMGYAYPDKNGPMLFYNSGILNATVEATACDTGGDPAKGDSMIAGICGWMRASDAASSAKVINCFAHFAPGGMILDLPMVNASAGALFGYTSLSASGSIEVAGFVTSLGANDLVVNGAPVSSSSARYGALYGMLPKDKVISVKNSYCVTGLPMYGETGNGVVLEDNEAVAPAELASVEPKLNAFASAYTDYALKAWKVVDSLPVL